jgi:hypothetical protein
VPGAEQDSFFVGALDLNAVSFDARVVLEGLVDDAPVEGIEGFQLDDITPTPDFFRGVLCLFHESIAGLGAVTRDINHNFWSAGVLLEKHPVGNVLEVGKSLALATDEATRVLRLHVQQETIFESMFLDGYIKA